MTTTVKATYANGVLTPLEPLDLEEGEQVTVSIEGRPSSEGATSVLRLIDNLHTVAPDLGRNDLPTDMAENYKHYLYGHPKDGDR